ncbi:hypothetical protein TCAL_16480 [Tigriopus californicus]|uniref:Platelet-derived growth factor (PDGF) family profile domain-containing protein n=1 Tax=Tigriopus californicus TaxID=6832 RepID=A0A553NUD2_TIGCA|nr:hypothetical protein TCAL_16480 [Tigriopus californicus]
MTDEAKHRLNKHHHHNRHRHRYLRPGTTTTLKGGSISRYSAAQALMDNKMRSSRGKYTMKEEVVRRIEIDHPCKLTTTAVKVTFPGMKSEVLVSFLGYKEPNLMFVNRCKGLCSSDAIGKVACVPTKRTWKKVNMQLKTQVLGRDAKEKAKELMLEDHTECGCQCLTMSPSQCIRPELFNNETCSCACDNSIYRRDQLQCEAYSDRKWDEATCSCRHVDETIPPAGGSLNIMTPARGDDLPRGHQVDPPSSGCTECFHCLGLAKGYGKSSIEAMSQSASGDMIVQNSWTIIAVCAVTIGVLGTTTIYYWRKTKQMGDELHHKSNSPLMLHDFGEMKSMDEVDLGFQDPSFECMLAAATTTVTSNKPEYILKELASPPPRGRTRHLEKSNSMNELDVQHLPVLDVKREKGTKRNGDVVNALPRAACPANNNPTTTTTTTTTYKSNSLGRTNHSKRTNRSSKSRNKSNGGHVAYCQDHYQTDLIQGCFENGADLDQDSPQLSSHPSNWFVTQ